MNVPAKLDNRTAYVDASDNAATVSVYFAARPDAEELLAELPKSLRARVTTLTYAPTGNYTEGSACAYVLRMQVQLAPDGTTGAVNETGLARLRSFGRHAARLGLTLEVVGAYSNSLPAEDTLALFAA